MDASLAEQLSSYSRGEITSRAVRDATGLNQRQVLDGLGQLLREHLAQNADTVGVKPGPAEPFSPDTARPC